MDVCLRSKNLQSWLLSQNIALSPFYLYALWRTPCGDSCKSIYTLQDFWTHSELSSTIFRRCGARDFSHLGSCTVGLCRCWQDVGLYSCTSGIPTTASSLQPYYQGSCSLYARIALLNIWIPVIQDEFISFLPSNVHPIPGLLGLKPCVLTLYKLDFTKPWVGMLECSWHRDKFPTLKLLSVASVNLPVLIKQIFIISSSCLTNFRFVRGISYAAICT